MTNLVLVTAPAVEPLTAAEVRARLNIGTEVTDAALNAFIKAARQTLDGRDGWLGRALITQKWKLTLDGRFPSGPIQIPLPPLKSIESVTYVDTAGAEQELPEEAFQVVEGEPARLIPAYGTQWPATRCQLAAVAIEFIAGYGDSGEAVVEPIRSAIALMVSNLRSLSARNLFISQDTVDGVGSKQYVVGGNAAAAIDFTATRLLDPFRVYL